MRKSLEMFLKQKIFCFADKKIVKFVLPQKNAYQNGAQDVNFTWVCLLSFPNDDLA